MRTFHLFFTGDYLDASGRVALPDIGLDLLENISYLNVGFLLDQKPAPDDPSHWDHLYSLEITAQHVSDANGIVIFRPWVKASAFSRGAENLVVLGRAGAGYDKIDLEACTGNDVAVFNTPDTLTHSTASAALTFILALAKKLPKQERLVRTGRWDLQPETMGDDLPGQTLGIIGLGRTGMELARLALLLGMRVIAYSPRVNPVQAEALGVALVPALDLLLRQSDFVSLHCRLVPHTQEMIGEREFRLMKSTAYFVNVGRGELVDQKTLVRALRERWIAGAALDVFEVEPLPIADPLLELDNVILTPHWLPSTRQATRDTMTSVLQGMLRAAQGSVPDNVVNQVVLERPGFLRKLSRFAGNREMNRQRPGQTGAARERPR
jgi:phosphoglycerate dehydrogenase-like enzyme